MLCRAHGQRPRRYLAQLLRTTPMESLLNRHVDMTTEIKTLDSDMQVRARRIGLSKMHSDSFAAISRARITPCVHLCSSLIYSSLPFSFLFAVVSTSVACHLDSARHAKSSCRLP